MELNSYIDHTNLKAIATTADIKKLCDEAIKYHFSTVCVNPCYVEIAKSYLENSTVNVCTVIGFPLGATTINTKEFEAIDAIDGKTLKVIIETCYLTKEEIKKMTEICNETFVNFIKTSTGFGTRGASVEDIEIINENKNDLLEIKASGGIKTLEQVEKLIDLGVTRIGTSSGVEIIKDSHKECDCHE